MNPSDPIFQEVVKHSNKPAMMFVTAASLAFPKELRSDLFMRQRRHWFFFLSRFLLLGKSYWRGVIIQSTMRGIWDAMSAQEASIPHTAAYLFLIPPVNSFYVIFASCNFTEKKFNSMPHNFHPLIFHVYFLSSIWNEFFSNAYRGFCRGKYRDNCTYRRYIVQRYKVFCKKRVLLLSKWAGF